MACRYTYKGKTYEAHEFDDVLKAMPPAEAAKFMPSVESIPSAPFVGRTDAWVSLALKRMIRYASDNGFDGIAWTNGGQQADRYDLSKHVDSVEVRWVPKREADAHYSVTATQGGRIVISEWAKGEAEIENLIGKDLAKKAIESINKEGKYPQRGVTFKGLDLKIGGEGMNAFYDRIVPNVANDVLKKLGGGRVGEVDVGIASRGDDTTKALDGTEEERAWQERYDAAMQDGDHAAAMRLEKEMPAKRVLRSTQPGFYLTEAMKAKAEGGMPLFSRPRDQTDTEAFRKWFGDSKVVDKDGKPLVVYHGTADNFSSFNVGGEGGIFFTDSRAHASGVYARKRAGSNVIPSYLSIQNPYEVSHDDWQEARGLTLQAARDAGYDGYIVRKMVHNSKSKSDTYIVFSPSQIKSAVGNRGTFDAASPDILLSRSTDDDLTVAGRHAQLRGSGGKIAERLNDLFHSNKTFNFLHKSIGTQYQKAIVDPHFRRVFRKGQEYLAEFSRAALDAADMAPTLLPKLEGFRDIPGSIFAGASKKDTQAAGKAILEGTLQAESGDPFSGKVFTDGELKKMGLTEKQVKLYREARAAIDASLDLLHASEVANMARTPEAVFGAALTKPKTPLARLPMVLERAKKDPGHAGEIVGDYLAEVAKAIQKKIDGMTFGGETGSKLAADLKAEKRRLLDLATTLVDKQDQIERLKAAGYAPLQRYGKYSVSVYSDGFNAKTGEPDLLYFSLHESEREANAVKRQLEQDPEFEDATVVAGIKSENGFQLYRGLTPDTLELFATTLGVGEDSVFQTYLKVAKNSRSAFKRMIHRKGTEGFQTDLTRSLASFITSNARAVAGNWHMGELVQAADAIPKYKGDVKDEAVGLVRYLQEPQEEAAFFRSLLFMNYLGGSLAAGLVNMTQPLTMTLPYLGQWGNAEAGKELSRALKDALKSPDKLERALEEAMARGIEEGIVAPHEVHQLHAEAMRNMGSNLAWRKAMTAWGAVFAATEAFNRRTTFIAAFRTAKRVGASNPYRFAVQAVEETQGIYNRGNRPNWARGAIGASIFTFKQFSVSYIELLVRLPVKQRLVALSVMFLLAGMQGLPFAEDLEDIIDTVAQRLGYSWNTRQEARRVLMKYLGRLGSDFVMHGASHLPGVPLDVQGRLGMGNLIPGSSIGKLTADPGREAADALGAAGAFAKGVFTAGGKALEGDFYGAGRAVLPVAFENVRRAVEMWQTGMYKDTRGNKVMNVTKGDAAVKLIGFQPQRVAKDTKKVGEQMQNIQLHKAVEDRIADKMAAARFEKETARTTGQERDAAAKLADANRELTRWNMRNPTAKITIEPSQITTRVNTMKAARSERITKRAPKEIRFNVREALE